jgi:uncharacterized membrane-anchored protein YhcB (DUF1043 family)
MNNKERELNSMLLVGSLTLAIGVMLGYLICRLTG